MIDLRKGTTLHVSVFLENSSKTEYRAVRNSFCSVMDLAGKYSMKVKTLAMRSSKKGWDIIFFAVVKFGSLEVSTCSAKDLISSG